MKGKRVTTVRQLCDLASDRKSVVCERIFIKPCAAAWVQNMQGRQIVRLINYGMYVYKKKQQEK